MDTVAFAEQLSTSGRSLESFGDPQLIALAGGVAVIKDGAVVGAEARIRVVRRTHTVRAAWARLLVSVTGSCDEPLLIGMGALGAAAVARIERRGVTIGHRGPVWFQQSDRVRDR